MTGHNDAVEEVLAAFFDHLERGTARPELDHLSAPDRQVAEDLMRLMETGRWIDPAASAPSLQALLAGTPFADALQAPAAAPALHRVQDVVADVDPRAEVAIFGDSFVSLTYLDLLARFYPVDGEDPAMPDGDLRALFDVDVDVDVVAVVATRSPDLLTRVVSRYDVDPTVSTAADRPFAPSTSVLPVALAARAILEHSAPEWGEFGLQDTALDLVDLPALEADIARRLVAEEAKRRYQGDKALAYRGLVGQEHRLVELVNVAAQVEADLAAELDRIARQVA